MKTGNRRAAIRTGALSIILSMTLAAGLEPMRAAAAEAKASGGGGIAILPQPLHRP